MLSCQKDKFSLSGESHYLNCAYMSPMLKSAEEAGLNVMQMKRDPSNIKPADFFESCTSLRSEFARLIGFADPNAIAIVPSVSYGIANAANNIDLHSGEEILILGEQFPSNVYVWNEKAKRSGANVVVINSPSNSSERVALWTEQILASINNRTKVAAMGHVHWTDGALFDLKAISEKIHGVGGFLIIDGTQSVGAMPFDVNEIKPDALICAGYKWLLGPYGIGLGYYNERFNNGEPIEYSWITRLGSEDFAGLVSYEDNYRPGAQRFDAGERSNFINVAMQLVALKQINEWGVVNIQDYCKFLATHFIEELISFGFYIEPSANRASHLFGVRLKQGQDPKNVARILSAKNVNVSVRGKAVRVSVNVYNSSDDLIALVECLKAIT